MNQLIDLRPDRFLRELRETGDLDIAATNAGMAMDEVHSLMASNRKFDLSCVECFLEYNEEQVIEIIQEGITGALKNMARILAETRSGFYTDFHRRWPQGPTEPDDAAEPFDPSEAV